MERRAVKFFIDWAGRLWKGPCSPDNTLHYAEFKGYMIVYPFSEIWVLERSAPPEDADEVSEERAQKAMNLWRTHAS